MTKYIGVLIVLLVSANCYTQNISAFSDANGKLYQFNAGHIKMMEYQKVKNLLITNNCIAYTVTNLFNTFFCIVNLLC